MMCAAAVEWATEGAAEYDVAALESPRLSDSARAAQEREQATTSTIFSLHQCVEVSMWHLLHSAAHGLIDSPID